MKYEEEITRLFYEGRIIALNVALINCRKILLRIERHGAPASMAALGLWMGLACGGDGVALLGFAMVLGASAISWCGLCAPAKRQRLILVEALCWGCALGAAVLRFQSQQEALCCTTKPVGSGELQVRALEGRLTIDSQTTARKNRKIGLKLRAMEFSGLDFCLRCEWKRSAYSQILLSGAGPRLSAGTTIRVDNVRGGDFFWGDARDIRQIGKMRFLAAVRAALVGRFAQSISMASGRAAPLAQALLLGVKDELDTEFKELFQAAGCAHLLALSGQHLSIICALVMMIGRRFVHKEKRVRRVSLCFAWLFVWLAGPGPSLLRAVFMLTMAEICKIFDRPQSSFALLSSAAVLLALFAPASINSLSSIYSFSAMAGLILFGRQFASFLKPYLPNSIAQAFAASMAAICGTAVVSVLSFGCLIPASILSATAAAPLMLAFMWIALSGGLLAWALPVVGVITVPALELLQTALSSVLAFGASLPAIHVESSVLWRMIVCLVIALFVCLIYAVPRILWRGSRRRMEGLSIQDSHLRIRSRNPLFDLQGD